MRRANASYPAALAAAAPPAATSGATGAVSPHAQRASGSTERSDNDSAALLWKLRAANAKKQGSGASSKSTSGSSAGENTTSGAQELSSVQDSNNKNELLATSTKSSTGSASKAGDDAASMPSSATKAGRRGPGRPKKSDDNAKHAAKWDDDVTALFLKLRFQDIRPAFERVRNNLEVGECWILLANTLSELSGRRFDSHQCQSKLRNLKKTWREMTSSAKTPPTSSPLFKLLSQYMDDTKTDERRSSLSAHNEALSEYGGSRTQTNSSVSVDGEEKSERDANASKANTNGEESDDQIDTGSSEHGDDAVSVDSGRDTGSPDARPVAEEHSTIQSSPPDIESAFQKSTPIGTEQAESATLDSSSPGSSRKRQKRNSTANTPVTPPVLSTATAVVAPASDHTGIDSGILSVAHGLRTMVEGVIASQDHSAEQRAILTELREHNALMKQYCAEVSKQTASLNALIDLLATKAHKKK